MGYSQKQALSASAVGGERTFEIPLSLERGGWRKVQLGSRSELSAGANGGLWGLVAEQAPLRSGRGGLQTKRVPRLRMRKTLVALVGIILALPLAYLGLLAFGALEHGYRWLEMDWNSDGRTTISEFFSAADIGKRAAIEGPKSCTVYYAYKDGLPVRVDCPAGIDKSRVL